MVARIVPFHHLRADTEAWALRRRLWWSMAGAAQKLGVMAAHALVLAAPAQGTCTGRRRRR
eukprot:scaffold255264_cov33-Tisochrysis_lutea.AAC.2